VPDLADVAALLADRTRARMLDELSGGTPIVAGELARRTGVAASTASEHLALLERGGLIVVDRRGRRREARLATPAVAEALEAISRLADQRRPRGLREANRMEALRRARSCYDHLAGAVGVALTDALVSGGALSRSDGTFTAGDSPHWERLGIDLDALRAGRRPLARACLDWTERRDHLAGALGAAVLSVCLERRWLERRSADRALLLTPAGTQALRRLGAAV
jgi:DNA-binding transcriptional ArsR family regulator